MKRYVRPPDEERVYSKNNIVIEVCYYLGVYPNGKTDMCVDVILTVDKCRKNLLKSDQIFDTELLEILKTNIDTVTPLEQIPIYAEFLKTNINMLLQYKKG